jgi:chemotaxis protein CheX
LNQAVIDPALQADLVIPFITAACQTMQEMAGAEIVPQVPYQIEKCQTLGDVSSVLQLQFDTAGALVLSFPTATAAAFTQRILAEVTAQIDEAVIRDGIGELANVIGGQAKALLHGTRFHVTFSTPTSVLGAGQPARTDLELTGLVVPFKSELGEFVMQIGISV